MDPVPPLTLPRSVLLALWLDAVAAGAATVRDAVRAVETDDEPHTVRGQDGAGPDGFSSAGPGPDDEGSARSGSGAGHLADLVAVWARSPHEVCAVLPVPGDVSGVPPSAAGAAVDAGEALLVHGDGRSWAAVPEVTGFGSALEPGHHVAWVVHAVPDWRATVRSALGTVAQAEQELRQGLLGATRALAALDVARWRPDAAQAIASLRQEDLGWDLPRHLDGRRVGVLVSAVRLRAIVALARGDDGAAVTAWQADERTAALHRVDLVARRATAAATALPATDTAAG